MGDESCTQWTTLFVEETKNKATGGLCASASQRAAAELAYQKKSEQISDENLFKLIIVSSIYIYTHFLQDHIILLLNALYFLH